MARSPRIDAPGTTHHIWSRGIERSVIFRDDTDRFDMRSRMSAILPECGAAMPAWSFMDNHLHFLVRRGPVSISTVMKRILTGYALRFKQRHDRSGYVFQGRFESDMVRDDVHLMNLIRYVHRNPLEAGIVSSIDRLRRYRWSGHAALVGYRSAHPFECVSDALRVFGEDPDEARRALVEWMNDREEVTAKDRFDAALSLVCQELGVSERNLRGGVRDASVSRARTLLCRQAVFDLGMKRADVARRLGISAAAVFYALRRS